MHLKVDNLSEIYYYLVVGIIYQYYAAETHSSFVLSVSDLSSIISRHLQNHHVGH